MKKLFPETPDVTQSVANRATRIMEKHLRLHRVEKARDLPEEAKIRLYRDLRFLFDGGDQPMSGSRGGGFSIRRFFSQMWEKLEDFLSAFETDQGISVKMPLVSVDNLTRSVILCQQLLPTVGK